MSIYVAINFPWTSQRDQNSCIYPNNLQTFRYMHEFWSRSEVHGKLIATCRPDFTNKYITATRALVVGVFRFWKYRHNVWYRAWNCGTNLQTFGYMQQFWSRWEVHGKLTATYRHDFRNKYITATRALVGGIFRFWKYRHNVWYRAWNCGTGLQTLGYMQQFWSRWEVHGKLIATYRHDFTNKYIIATRALVGGVFRFWKYRHTVWYRAWNCGTNLQTFGYMHEF